MDEYKERDFREPEPPEEIHSVDDLTEHLLWWLTSLCGLEWLGTGRNRATYRVNETTVWKFPVSFQGFRDNVSEASIYEKTGGRDGEFAYAKCHIIAICGMPVLEMEYVKPTWKTNFPKWTLSIDCQQVGYNKDGILVAYDYA